MYSRYQKYALEFFPFVQDDTAWLLGLSDTWAAPPPILVRPHQQELVRALLELAVEVDPARHRYHNNITDDVCYSLAACINTVGLTETGRTKAYAALGLIGSKKFVHMTSMAR